MQSSLWPESEPRIEGSVLTATDPVDFARHLAALLGDGLLSVVLHGPGVGDDGPGEPRELKLLVVVQAFGARELEAAGPPVRAWLDAGQPMPLFFSKARLLRSAATYPVEMLDIKEGHRVLHGEDLVSGLDVSKSMLLLDIERGLKSQLHRICEAHLRLSGRKGPFRAALHRELPRLSLLLRSSLRLFVASCPSACLSVLSDLDQHVPGVMDGLAPLYAFVRGEPTGELRATGSAADVLSGAVPAYDRLIASVEGLRLRAGV